MPVTPPSMKLLDSRKPFRPMPAENTGEDQQGVEQFASGGGHKVIRLTRRSTSLSDGDEQFAFVHRDGEGHPPIQPCGERPISARSIRRFRVHWRDESSRRPGSPSNVQRPCGCRRDAGRRLRRPMQPRGVGTADFNPLGSRRYIADGIAGSSASDSPPGENTMPSVNSRA